MPFIQNVKNWAIKNKVKACLLLVLASFALFLFYKSLLPKPWEADFDPQDFRLSQFSKMDEFAKFAQVHLPIGTPRAFVDSILIDVGGMTARERVVDPNNTIVSSPVDEQVVPLNPKITVIYSKGSRVAEMFLSAGWQIFAFYDENGKLLQLSSVEKTLLK